MNIVQIEKNLQKLMKSCQQETFIYDLLLAYGLPKASITRLQKGNLNLSKVKGELSWKKKVFFKEEFEKDLHVTLLDLAEEIKHDQRFVIVTDYKLLLAIDTKTKDKLDVDFKDLAKNYDFFLPWAGMEKTQHQNENPADVKAAERMAKLFDEIKKDNPSEDEEFNSGLNVFLSRLLFCFFAEDTDIFEDNQFTNAISSHTQVDGSDLGTYLDELFEVLNTPDNERKGLPTYLEAFPYVNGGLFRQRHSSPEFSRKSRQIIIEAGELDWKDINPDIFGSMFQGVIDPGKRGSLGAHYTSVPNIMKVIEPLFLDELYEAFEKAKGNSKKISELLHRLSQVKIFDPACGSGNFLIIAYKELRRLEMKIFRENNMMAFSQISLSQFYGIELDDFAHEIAQLSLWLAEHQMNVEFFKQFGRTNPTLPLKEAGKIVCGNACRLNWEDVCPKDGVETYILGNPPYRGARMQDKDQKEDMRIVFKGDVIYKDLDYILCWFEKSSQYIKGGINSFAFVSTNSITQGEQVGAFWPRVLDDLQIYFAYPSFKWDNSAKGNAGVTVVIIGIKNNTDEEVYLYSDSYKRKVKNINAYLTEGSNIYVSRSKDILSEGFPDMTIGSMARDGGNLILSEDEMNLLLNVSNDLNDIIKPLYGSQEFIQGKKRYCLWIEDDMLEFANQYVEIKRRISNVYDFRKNSKAKTTNGYATIPHKFAQRCYKDTSPIIIPSTSSERREYIPIGYLSQGSVVTNSANVIYDSDPFFLGVLCSKMHNVWVKSIGGQLESRIRYSTEMVYNTFPFPEISENIKNDIRQTALRIIEARESYPELTYADLYDPERMPENLRLAHFYNNQAIEMCYRKNEFKSDKERLEFMLSLYKKMKEKK